MMRATAGPARALALAGVFAVAVVPGVASAQRAPRVSSVTVTPPEIQISVGQEQYFIADAFDRSSNSVPVTFTFSSSNPRCATIDATGKAIGVSQCVTIITASTGTGANRKFATATLSVVGAALTGAAVPPPPAVISQGVTTVAPPPPTNPRPAVGGRPGSGPGWAAIERQPDGSGPAEGLVVQPLRVVLVKGESRQLAYNAMRLDGQNAERVPIVFSIAPGGERLITVDSVGFIRAAGDTGRAQVLVQVPNNARIVAKQVSVEVRGDSVRFQRAELWLPPGTTDTLRIVVPAQDRALVPRGDIQFSTSDETKVRVSALQPVINTVAPGVARILGESPYFSISMQVHVLRPVAALAGGPADSALTLAMNGRQVFSVIPKAADSTVVAEAPLRWTLLDTNTVKFDTATKTLRAVRIGETRLSVSAPFARDSNTTRSWRIRVVAGGLSISRTRLGLGVGERTSLTVQLLDDRRQPIVGQAVDLTWTSSADTIARYADGAVQGLRIGHATLTARTAWDSLVRADVYVSGQLLAPAQRHGWFDLYEFSADSTPRFVQITNDAAVETDPAFSPDLTRIAWVAPPADRPASTDLYVANADGLGAQRLTIDSAVVAAPVFVRPNGEQIVFQSNKSGRAQLYIINRDGTGRRQLTFGEVHNQQPDVSPDGRKILFVSLRQPPRGRQNYDIFEMNIDGTGEHAVTNSPRPEDTPHYAPDGRSFYFLRDEAGSPQTKRVYRQVLADSVGSAQPLAPTSGMFLKTFSVSADGSLLVLTKLESARGVGEVPQVLLLNLSTGATMPIRVAQGELLSSPTFRPATPPATPAAPAAPTSAPSPAPPSPTAPAALPSPTSPAIPPPTAPATPRTPPPGAPR